VTADDPYRNGLLQRFARWLRRTWRRPRRREMMIEPDPAALKAWRSLLGIGP
jgi:hypothetical protein